MCPIVITLRDTLHWGQRAQPRQKVAALSAKQGTDRGEIRRDSKCSFSCLSVHLYLTSPFHLPCPTFIHLLCHLLLCSLLRLEQAQHTFICSPRTPSLCLMRTSDFSPLWISCVSPCRRSYVDSTLSFFSARDGDGWGLWMSGL